MTTIDIAGTNANRIAGALESIAESLKPKGKEVPTLVDSVMMASGALLEIEVMLKNQGLAIQQLVDALLVDRAYISQLESDIKERDTFIKSLHKTSQAVV